MKNSLALLMLFIGSILNGQTDSIEKAVISKLLADEKIGQGEFSRIRSGWDQIIKGIKKYPDVPLDQNGEAHYAFLYEFKGLNKENLFDRTLEWLSINYGFVPSNIYSSLEDGKIIFKNSTHLITQDICNYSSIISIKNEKVLIEFINITYQTYYEGHYSNETWIPEQTINFNINEVYPIILKKPSLWGPNLRLLEATNEFIKAEIINLHNYITSYDYSYRF
jgi:hypothetical protein